MGLSLLTVLEIFTNPKDLDFQVEELGGEAGGKFVFSISRGPVHNFKLLIDTQPVFASRQEASGTLRDLLRNICRVAADEISRPDSLPAAVANPEGQPIEGATNILRLEDVDRIYEQLIASGHAATYQ